MEEKINKIKEYVKYLNPEAEDNDVDFKVRELVDRVLLYMNRKDLPDGLERTLAKSLVNYENDVKNLRSDEREVTSISDNGQSISFASKNGSRLVKENDLIILEGIKDILDKYKRAGVFKDDESY